MATEVYDLLLDLRLMTCLIMMYSTRPVMSSLTNIVTLNSNLLTQDDMIDNL